MRRFNRDYTTVAVAGLRLEVPNKPAKWRSTHRTHTRRTLNGSPRTECSLLLSNILLLTDGALYCTEPVNRICVVYIDIVCQKMHFLLLVVVQRHF